MTTNITRLRELEAKATNGRWVQDDGALGGKERTICAGGEIVVQTCTNPHSCDPNMQTNSQSTDLAFIAELRNALPALLDELEAARKAYDELLYAVGNKYEGETRHQTALRYIREHESRTEGPCSAHAAAGKGDAAGGGQG